MPRIMSPLIIHDYPRWAELTVWTLRIASYGFCAMTGAAAIFLTPASLSIFTFPAVGSMLLFGMVCAVATFHKRYIVEWISLFFLNAGISVFVGSIWVATLENNKAIAAASIFSVLISLMFIRLVDLTVFWQMSARAARLQQGLDKNAD